jgi:ligand-binding sensor domain-containing protein
MGGGNRAGLDLLDPSTDTFKHYRHDPANERSLSDNGVAFVYQDRQGALWVGTRNGLNRVDPVSGAFVRYYPAGRDAGYTSSNYITAILEDRPGNLWLATRLGLVKLDRATGQFSHFWHDPANPQGLGSDYVSSIWEDQSGFLCVGAVLESGLSVLKVKTGKISRYRLGLEQLDGATITAVNHLYEDREGMIWVGTRSEAHWRRGE